MNRRFLKAGCILMTLLLLFLSAAAPVSAKTAEEEESIMTLPKELVSMHKNTYQNLVDRLTDRGYSATSVTGTYNGMFPRDSSIEALAMLEFGDLESAQKLLNYLLTYNQWYGCGYMAHILDNLQDADYGNDYLSDPDHFAGTQAYYAQTESNRDLYLLNAPNNKAAQPFAVPYGSIAGMRLNLTKTYDTDHVTVRILTDYRNDATVIGTASYTFGENPSGWQTVLFDQPVSVAPNRMYYLVVSAEDSGRVVWTGISAGGDFQSINYDLSADGGWRTGTGDITAFEILSEEEDASLAGVYAQRTADRDLYLLNAPNNKAVQPFTAPFTRIDSVMAYLTCAEDTDRVLVRIMQDYRNDATVVAQQEFEIGGTKDGWQRLVFDAPVEIEAGKRYYLEISAPEGCGRVVWKGSEAIDGYQAVNYDRAAYEDSYRTDSKTTAFAIVPYVPLSEQPAACRFSFAASGSLTGARVSLRTAGAGGSLCVELRSTADGPAIARAEAETLLSGENTYTLSFDRPAAIAADQIYYLTVSVTGAAGETVLLPGENSADSGDCYAYDGEAWRPVARNFGVEPVRAISGLAQLGGETYAEQEIPTYDGETVTAVKVRLGKTADASGTVRATLYKQIGEELLYVDESTLPLEEIGEDTEYTFRFGLPIEKRANERGNYLLRLSAEDAPAGSVTWFGAEDSDRFTSRLYDGQTHEIGGDLSFTAYRSYLTSTCDAARQVDCTYMVVYAWVQFYKTAATSAEYGAWLEETYPLIRELCNYYLKTDNQFSDRLNLIYNPHFEHTRNTQYHKGYDLITNVFASQSLYEMSGIALEFGDRENAAFWAEMDRLLVSGIEETLICEFDGETIYAEMLGQMVTENGADYFIPGFSWVNLAPVAAGWHAADTRILQNTLDKYKKFGSVDYDGYSMLDACIFLNADGTGLDTSKGVNGTHAHVIGKGWSWQLLFAAEQGDTESVEQLIGFSLAHRAESNLYTENWTQKQPGVIQYSDPGNQEHASWQLYAICRLFPSLTRRCEPDVSSAEALIARAESAKALDYSDEAFARLVLALEAAQRTMQEPDLLQAEVDLAVAELSEALADTLPVKAGDVDGDGGVTVSDVVELRKLIVAGAWSDREFTAGNLDGDGTLSVSDVVELRKLIVSGG